MKITPANKKKVFFVFCLLQVTYWGCYASFLGYFSAFMLANGMSNTVLSLILSIYLMAAFAGSFFWGSLSDRLRTNKKTMLIQVAVCLAAGQLIYQFAHVTWLVAVLYPILGFATVPVGSNLDSWILKSFPEEPNYYGISRGVAAFGYAVIVLIMGQLVANVGYHVMPIGLAISAGATILITALLPDSPQIETSGNFRFSIKDVGGLFKNKTYVTILVLLFTIGLAIVPISNMKIVLYQSVGGDVKWVGYDAFAGCMVQVPIFLMAGKMREFKPTVRLFAAVCGCLSLLFIYAFAKIPYLIIVGSMMYFLGYSLLLPTYRELIGKSVNPNLMTTAQSLADAVIMSLAGMTGLLYSGYVIDNLGLKTLMFIGMGIFIIPVFIVIRALLRNKI
ncbi:MAG: MFS transporter [Lachnospiraceae bacterium]|nr:MFS transporter [Lachnospiraceae bacterium]